MHNLDRVQLESEQELAGLGHEQEQGENEQFLGDILGAITGGEVGVPLHESQELELASELLGVTSEQELEQFLGDVFRTVGRNVGQFVRSDTGRALGGILKDAAGQALPVVGRAVADYVSPGSGDTGASLAQKAGTLLGLELEGLSPPDQEFEAARQFVRFASAATKQAAAAPRNVAPHTAARAAVVAAAHHHAPGLAQMGPASGSRPRLATPRAGAVHAAGPSRRPPGPGGPPAPMARHAGVLRPAPLHAGPARPPSAARPAAFFRPAHAPRHYAAPYAGPAVTRTRRPPAPAHTGVPSARPPSVAYGTPWHRWSRSRGYPWYWGYERPAGYTPPAGQPAPAHPAHVPTGAVPTEAWPRPPAAYTGAPAAYATVAPTTGNGWAAGRREWGQWQRRGSVIVLYGA
jgi:hypothetical protein